MATRLGISDARAADELSALPEDDPRSFHDFGLSQLESEALRRYLEGSSYEEMAEELGCDTKTIDNALQRVKRKIIQHQQSRQVLQ